MDCRAVERHAHDDFSDDMFLPPRFEGDQADPPSAAPPPEVDTWDIDASVIPWTAGLLNLNETKAGDFHNGPLVFYPTSQDLALDFENDARPGSRAWPSEVDAPPCYVILFGVGEEATEGIYTLRTLDVDGSTNVDTVVAFESEVDAQRFATLLEATMFHKPSVFSLSWADVTEWCNETNTRCRLEAAGSLLIPPEANVGVTDWERALALQRGEFQVLDSEPAYGAALNGNDASLEDALAPGFFIDGPEWVYGESRNSQDADFSNIVDSKLADANIAAIRADLERLLNH